MAQGTIIPQTVKVKKVLKATASKYGKASIIVPFNGNDEFLGLNKGVDENAFVEGNTYKVGILVSKSGKRFVESIIEDLGAGAAPSNGKANGSTTSHTASAPAKPAYKDNSAGQREGAIGHYASRITSALVAAGQVANADDALAVFKKLKAGIEADF